MSSLFLFAALAAVTPAADTMVEVRVQPAQPLIERTRLGQALNFDFVVENKGAEPLRLDAVELFVRDAKGRMVSRLHIGRNGMIASIDTVPNREVKPGRLQTLYNPFHTFPADMALDRLDYRLLYKGPDGSEIAKEVEVRPRTFVARTKLRLPIRGRYEVSDAHDFYAHHRRVDFADETLRFLGLTANPTRYSFDFRAVDGQGNAHRGDPKINENWVGFGYPIFAPAAGRVARMVDAMPDDASVDMEAIEKRKDALAIFGNFIIIDHGNGEYSHIAHIKQGSARVKTGDAVAAGQEIAAIGNSGGVLSPHLHYQLVATPDLSGEGLPARFESFTRVAGSDRRRLQDAAPETGDLIEN